MILNNRIAILIDANNIERSLTGVHGFGVNLDYDDYIPMLVGKRQLTMLIYFKEGEINKKLSERLNLMFCGMTVSCHKSADIPLTIQAVQISEKVDTVIIMSGDSDYTDLIFYLKSRGNRVEVVAVKESLSRRLEQLADVVHLITRKHTYNVGTKKEITNT